jgi:N-acetylmuramoyl-L-alanine amidase
MVADAAQAQRLFWGRDKKVVVLNPGHGGDDTGAEGPGGSAEKMLALRLCRLIESELKADFRVSLTRTDDYQLEILRRTEIANNLQADAFISVHAGGGFSSKAGGITVYTFEEPEGLLYAPPGQPAPASSDTEAVYLWDYLQQRHLAESHRLAEAIKVRIQQAVSFTDCRRTAAPLTALRGADMPAILIEIGYLTNPMEEKALMDEAVLMDLARAVGDGVSDFFKSREQP